MAKLSRAKYELGPSTYLYNIVRHIVVFPTNCHIIQLSFIFIDLDL